MSDEDELMSEGSLQELRSPAATLLWDRQNCIPLDKCLSNDDVILLLTPLVVPPESQDNNDRDPFEPLGKALAEKHPMVRHVPYSKNGGVTGVHVAFVKRADVVIFVITGPGASEEEVLQGDLAATINEACDSRPLILIFCCQIDDHTVQQLDFPTSIRTTGFSAPDLLAVSNLLLGGDHTVQRSATQTQHGLRELMPPWSVEEWKFERDLGQLHALWNEDVSPQFRIDIATFSNLICRDGYAMHYVVRDPSGGGILGFCATYTTYVDSTGEQLIGSVAAVMVKREARGRGIGIALHNTSLNKLKRVRGVRRLLLGTTFPRLLCGIPIDHSSIPWFKKRGWVLDHSGPGKGRLVIDWLLPVIEAPPANLASAGLSFRSCGLADFEVVLEMVDREAKRKNGFGWYDQYARILDSGFIGDIFLGFEGSTIVATAITYIPNSGNPTAADIPWAASIGRDVGGISCVCIIGEHLSLEPPGR